MFNYIKINPKGFSALDLFPIYAYLNEDRISFRDIFENVFMDIVFWWKFIFIYFLLFDYIIYRINTENTSIIELLNLYTGMLYSEWELRNTQLTKSNNNFMANLSPPLKTTAYTDKGPHKDNDKTDKFPPKKNLTNIN